MSKKILKRSLVLSALMAFVITGSAWAEGTVDQHQKVSSGESLTPAAGTNYSGCKGGSEQGGAFLNNGTLKLNGGNFTKNVASVGGAIANVGGTLEMTGVTFKGNTITYSGNSRGGSAIYNSDGVGTWTNCTFSNNSTSPAVWVTGVNSDIKLVNNKFIDNSYGGIQVVQGKVTIEGKENQFINNPSKGGIYVSSTGIVNFAADSKTVMSDNPVDIYTKHKDTKVNIGENAVVTSNSGVRSTDGEFNINGGTLEVGADSTIKNFGGDGGTLKYLDAIKITVTNNNTETLNLAASGVANDAVGGDASKLIGDFNFNGKENTQMVLDEGNIQGRKVVNLFLNEENKLEEIEVISKEVNTKSDAVSDAGMVLKGHWRAHMNDMNKRMGELRNANGEHGVWTRMVRGESEYQGAKIQYNQYQLGYDEKLSVDKRWTVGAAVTFSEGDASYGFGSTDDKSTAFAIYGSKLNEDGTFVDFIARYAHLESDLDDRNYGTGDYSTNGMSVSAEFGKRIQQGNGLWIEPQVELTYGTVDSADVTMKNDAQIFNAHYDSMDSFIARAGFALGKDIKQGNVYARASYLYDFDGETKTQFVGGDPIKEDFGGGWWEVGVGANINLSKATYIYADVEKTFGGEVDTNWQWNLGVRYSF